MNIAIVLAGGIGSRMGKTELPKQFIDIYGKPIMIHTIEKIDIHPEIDQVVIGCQEEHIDDIRILVRKYSLDKVKKIVSAGSTRQKTVYNCLLAIKNETSDTDIIMIHDAVRPLITSRIIEANIEATTQYGAVDTVIPASDTIVKSIEGCFINEIPKRKEHFMGQTPQSFRYKIILDAHEYCMKNGIEDSTDDCQMVIKNGGTVSLVMGDKLNFKITNQDDLTLLKALLKTGKLERI